MALLDPEHDVAVEILSVDQLESFVNDPAARILTLLVTSWTAAEQFEFREDGESSRWPLGKSMMQVPGTPRMQPEWSNASRWPDAQARDRARRAWLIDTKRVPYLQELARQHRLRLGQVVKSGGDRVIVNLWWVDPDGVWEDHEGRLGLPLGDLELDADWLNKSHIAVAGTQSGRRFMVQGDNFTYVTSVPTISPVTALTQRTIVVHVPASIKDNFEFGLKNATWAFKKKPTEPDAPSLGDEIVFVHAVEGGPRQSPESFATREVGRVVRGIVKQGIYEMSEPFWPNETDGISEYPYRFEFESVEDTRGAFPGIDIMQAAKRSGEQGRPAVVGQQPSSGSRNAVMAEAKPDAAWIGELAVEFESATKAAGLVWGGRPRRTHGALVGIAVDQTVRHTERAVWIWKDAIGQGAR